MFTLTRRAVMATAAAAPASLSPMCRPAWAADRYPARPVAIIVPFAAGGSADVYARLLAPRLQAALGQPFIVDDKPGAGSIIGTDYVKNAAPDGYKLLLISNTHTVNETLFEKKPFKLMTDFVPIAPINSSDLVLVTRPGLGVATVAELIGMARADPGKLSYASSGPGTPYHMAGELFKQMAGVDILHVPYKGSSTARVDVMGSQVDLMFDATTTMANFIKTQKVKALATTGTTRSTVLTTLPTVAETVPGYEAVIWLGLLAPKGVPPGIVTTLSDALATILANPELQSAWTRDGVVPLQMTPEAFGVFMTEDIAKWARVVKLSGAKAGE